jgi:hypothetical protein
MIYMYMCVVSFMRNIMKFRLRKDFLTSLALSAYFRDPDEAALSFLARSIGTNETNSLITCCTRRDFNGISLVYTNLLIIEYACSDLGKRLRFRGVYRDRLFGHGTA